jgi:hypothetical protein
MESVSRKTASPKTRAPMLLRNVTSPAPYGASGPRASRLERGVARSRCIAACRWLPAFIVFQRRARERNSDHPMRISASSRRRGDFGAAIPSCRFARRPGRSSCTWSTTPDGSSRRTRSPTRSRSNVIWVVRSRRRARLVRDSGRIGRASRSRGSCRGGWRHHWRRDAGGGSPAGWKDGAGRGKEGVVQFGAGWAGASVKRLWRGGCSHAQSFPGRGSSRKQLISLRFENERHGRGRPFSPHVRRKSSKPGPTGRLRAPEMERFDTR